MFRPPTNPACGADFGCWGCARKAVRAGRVQPRPWAWGAAARRCWSSPRCPSFGAGKCYLMQTARRATNRDFKLKPAAQEVRAASSLVCTRLAWAPNRKGGRPAANNKPCWLPRMGWRKRHSWVAPRVPAAPAVGRQRWGAQGQAPEAAAAGAGGGGGTGGRGAAGGKEGGACLARAHVRLPCIRSLRRCCVASSARVHGCCCPWRAPPAALALPLRLGEEWMDEPFVLVLVEFPTGLVFNFRCRRRSRWMRMSMATRKKVPESGLAPPRLAEAARREQQAARRPAMPASRPAGGWMQRSSHWHALGSLACPVTERAWVLQKPHGASLNSCWTAWRAGNW